MEQSAFVGSPGFGRNDEHMRQPGVSSDSAHTQGPSQAPEAGNPFTDAARGRLAPPRPTRAHSVARGSQELGGDSPKGDQEREVWTAHPTPYQTPSESRTSSARRTASADRGCE